MKKTRLVIYKSFGKYKVTMFNNYINNIMDERKVNSLTKDLQESVDIVINTYGRYLKDDESVVIHIMNDFECEAIWTVTNKGVFAADNEVIK